MAEFWKDILIGDAILGMATGGMGLGGPIEAGALSPAF